MSYNINVDDWYDDAITLKAKGFSTRKIAVALFNNENHRNRLNIFYKQESVIEDVEERAKELEIEDSVIGVQLQNDYTDWQGKPKPELSKPKLLFYDIETTLAKSYHFGQWKQNLSVKQQVQEGHLLSHAWAWGDSEVVGSILTREEVVNRDPERLVLEAWSLLDNADVVVAHYGKKFDIPKLNGYFLKYGLQPPSPYRVIDTKEISSKKFLLPFNSLEYLAKALGVKQKIDNSGIQLWIDCDQGKQEALDEMLAYNIGDIEALRDVYYRLISWDNNGVNMALYNDEHTALCTHCGSDDITCLDGKYAYTAQRKYSLFRCNSCKATLRSNRKTGSGNSLVRVVN